MITSRDEPVPSTCVNPTLTSTVNELCGVTHTHVTSIPMGFLSSFVDLQGDYSQRDLERANVAVLINGALEQMDTQSTGQFSPEDEYSISIAVFVVVASMMVEPRFGLSTSLITRLYYTILPNQKVSQEQIEEHLKV